MFLSPTAQPFQPALEFAIFNDGVPCSVFYGCHPEHDVIHHIPDEAIDELFPPTAEEVLICKTDVRFLIDVSIVSYSSYVLLLQLKNSV